MNAASLIDYFGMKPHPEGGFYVQTYKSAGSFSQTALSEVWKNHVFSTGILFLLNSGSYSHLHRLRQDEMWHFYLGGPLRLAMLHPDGRSQEIILGTDVLHGQQVQYVVPAGTWFGATHCSGSSFALVGCTVAPGFEFTDFELAQREQLLAHYPAAYAMITEFTLPTAEEYTQTRGSTVQQNL